MSVIVNGIELTEVIYAGVNLDIIKVKKGTAEAVTVFEKMTQLATPQNVTADGTVVSWDEVKNATSYEVLADGASIGEVENVTEDALAGTWVFNDVLEIYSVFNYTINFTSNGTAYSALKNDYSDELDWYFYYNNTKVYYPSLPEWSNAAYKTINITSKLSEVTNGDQLLTWLQTNATKQ